METDFEQEETEGNEGRKIELTKGTKVTKRRQNHLRLMNKDLRGLREF
jgi:hypothetical protein